MAEVEAVNEGDKKQGQPWYSHATKYQPAWYTNAILLIGEKVIVTTCSIAIRL